MEQTHQLASLLARYGQKLGVSVRLLNDFDFIRCGCPPASSTSRASKANVLFLAKKPASETPWTRELWIYDLLTNQNFT